MTAVYDLKKKKVKELKLEPSIFERPLNETLLHQAILNYQTNQRRGTSNTLTRSDVRGSTVKIYRQKGTGNARHGDIKAPTFVGGGTVFGPHPRNWFSKMPVKMRRGALCEALSLKNKQGDLLIVDKLEMAKPKTKEAVKILKGLGLESSLVVVAKVDDALTRSFRNIPYCKVCTVTDLNALDVIRYKNILLTAELVSKVEQWLQA
ncbi:MAG: 50S ribosomal protein L4 [bacterium]|nr:50S ribosomal protein L4 [bacterium]